MALLWNCRHVGCYTGLRLVFNLLLSSQTYTPVEIGVGETGMIEVSCNNKNVAKCASIDTASLALVCGGTLAAVMIRKISEENKRV